jgi:glycine oxidase
MELGSLTHNISPCDLFSAPLTIVGGGIMGRLLALTLWEKGHRNLQIWDEEKSPLSSPNSPTPPSWIAGGMLSPMSEMESAAPIITQLGLESLELWPKILKIIDPEQKVYYRQRGSLVVAHRQDLPHLVHLRERIQYFFKSELEGRLVPDFIPQAEILKLEPNLNPQFHQALYLAQEAQVASAEVMKALGAHFEKLSCAYPGKFQWVKKHFEFHHPPQEKLSVTFDCRGLSAKDLIPSLRGVRGEIITIKAPQVEISRPIRLMHPKFPVYIIPRADHHYLVGATMVENEGHHPISVQSTLELLSAAYNVHRGFALGSLEEIHVSQRPTMPDANPHVSSQLTSGPQSTKNLKITINGLYRHGYLLAPSLAHRIVENLLKTEGEKRL